MVFINRSVLGVCYNGFWYVLLSGLALNLASLHQTKNLRRFLEVGEN